MESEVPRNRCSDEASGPPSNEGPGDSPSIVVNGQRRPLGGIATVADLVAELGWSDRPCAVELNREVVPRRDHATAPIGPDDRIEVVTLVGGG